MGAASCPYAQRCEAARAERPEEATARCLRNTLCRRADTADSPSAASNKNAGKATMRHKLLQHQLFHENITPFRNFQIVNSFRAGSKIDEEIVVLMVAVPDG